MVFWLLRRLFSFEALLVKRERLRRRYRPEVDLLEERRLLSAVPQLLKDINVNTKDSAPGPFVQVGTIVFFTANDGNSGTELWRSDGSDAGTTLVKDISPGSADSVFSSLTNVSGTLFFATADAHGTELWLSNGTSAGTTLVADIFSGPNSSNPSSLSNVNGTLLFVANDGASGTELWRSNGMSAGTTLVADISPGALSSNPASLINVSGTLLFAANDGTNGKEIWRSNGTSSGTTLIRDIAPIDSYPLSLTNVNGTLFFSANDGTDGTELWRSIGTSAGTVLVNDISSGAYDSNPTSLTNVSGTLFFSANDGTDGTELWRSIGTSAGTVLVKDISSGSYDSYPTSLTNVNGTLFFTANDGTDGTELWRSVGRSAGTTLVRDIAVGAYDSSPSSLTNVNGTLFFSANDKTSNGTELWRSIGTSTGTTLVSNISAGFYADSNPAYLNNVNGTLFFAANDGAHGKEVWTSNGTSTGTFLVKDINSVTNGPTSSNPISFTNLNGTVFFAADDGPHGMELWKSNGTSLGTVFVADISPGSYSSYPAYLTNVNGTLFFASNDGTHGTELWRSNGTSAGTSLVMDINSGTTDSYPAYLANISGTLFFVANDGTHGTELWRSNGTSAGTTLVMDISSGTADSFPALLTNVNGTLFFQADDGVHGTELWRSNGTSAGTILVMDVLSGTGNSLPYPLTNVSGTLFFAPDDGTHGFEPWRTNGTSAGTTLVMDVLPGTDTSDPVGLTNVSGTLFFVANDGTHGAEVWRSNGTSSGTTLVTDILSGTAGSGPSLLTNANGRLFFVAGDGTHGVELWSSNGTSGGTTLARDILSGSSASMPNQLTNVNGVLFFQANDGVHGTELWDSDGTCVGTRFVGDIAPGTVGSSPANLSSINGTLFFSANDGTTGTEPWLLLPDHPPSSNRDSYALNEDATLIVLSPGVLANDTDADNDALAIIGMSGTAHGTVTVNANGSFTYVPSADFNGTDSFTYQLGDNLLVSNTATVTIVVNAVNDAPSANNDFYSIDEDTTLFLAAAGVLGNDTDVDPGSGQPETLTAIVVGGVSHGTVTLNSNGSFTYVGSQNFNGTDSFTYKVDDGGTGTHLSNTATVTIVVNAVNDAPVANNDSYAVNQNATLTVAAAGVLANDTDVDPGTGQPQTLTAILVGGVAHGTLTLNSNGSFSYIGSANFNGTDHFTYKTSDGGLGSNTATVTIVVNSINAAPVANNDSYSFFEDQTLTLSSPAVLANDTDADGDTLTVRLITGPSHGTLTLQSNGAFAYMPSANYNGSDSFTYRPNDGALDGNVATVTLTIIPVNDAPVACNDLYSVFEDQSLSVGAPGVLGNDFDIDSPTLTALLVNPPLHGTLTLNANGSLAYVPAANYNGTDSFTYKANDGSLNSNVATVSVVVVSVNDPPVSGDDSYSVFEDATLSVAAPGVLNNDSDIDSPTLTPLLAGGPGHGTLTFNADGSFTYAPSANYNGTDSFTYRTNDGSLSSNLATVTLVVDPVNDAPVAGDDARSVFENGTLSVAAAGVLLNDSDIDSPTLTALPVTGPAHGTLTLNADGSLTYIPNINYSGTDSFTYKANDGLLNSNLATVSISVDPVNQAPTANNDAYSLFEDFTLTKTAPGALANDTDVDTPVLTANLATGPGHGTLSFNTNGAFTYVPGLHYFGTDSFTYKANDGLLNSDVATVKITVIAVNHAPVANSNSYSVFEDSSLSVGTPGVLNNDSDIDGNSLTSILITSPTHGMLTLRSNGAFTYTPAIHYSGGDSFTYRANDGSLNSTAATVTLNVLFVNHAPTANNDAYTVQGDTTLVVAVASGVLANDTDVENSALSAILSANPAHGTLTINSNGSFTYTPSSGFAGTDSFRYRANDGSLNSSQATVTLTVQAPGPVAPSATDVSDLVRAVSSALTDNHDGTFTGTITITNITSDTDIDGPLLVMLTNLTSGVTAHNKTGDTPAGDPYITIPASALPGGKLAHGQSTMVTVIFDNPLTLSINYAVTTLSGVI